MRGGYIKIPAGAFAHPLMSIVNLGTRDTPPSPQTREKLLYRDRATVGAKPGDVGKQTLIRGFSHDRVSSGAVPVYIRASTWGRPHRVVGNSPAVAYAPAVAR